MNNILIKFGLDELEKMVSFIRYCEKNNIGISTINNGQEYYYLSIGNDDYKKVYMYYNVDKDYDMCSHIVMNKII